MANQRRFTRKLTILATSAAMGVLTLAVPSVTVQAATTDPHATYVDCSAQHNGSGHVDSPLNSIEAANGVVLQPGHSLLFKRGVTCNGQLNVQGKGTQEQRITVGAYGDATARAAINANGAGAAVLARNNEYLTITDLELQAPGNGQELRYGLRLVSEDGGVLRGITAQRLYIHNVRGMMPANFESGPNSQPGAFIGKGDHATGGIVIESLGSTTPSAFKDLTIINNRIDDVDREGIYFWSNWCRRGDLKRWGNMCHQNYKAVENAKINGNYLTNIGGDGIVLTGIQHGEANWNRLDGFNKGLKAYNAGIWMANSDHILMEHNRVSGGKEWRGHVLDSMSYDIDHASTNITLRYNSSFNNEGGFLLFCPDPIAGDGYGGVRDLEIYGNVSIGDEHRWLMHGCGGDINDARVYNNTFYAKPGQRPVKVWSSEAGRAPQVEIFNNIFASADEGVATFGFPAQDAEFFDVHHNYAHNIPNDPVVKNPVLGEVTFHNADSVEPADFQINEGAPKGVALPRLQQQRDFSGLLRPTIPTVGAFEPGSNNPTGLFAQDGGMVCHEFDGFAPHSEVTGQLTNKDGQEVSSAEALADQDGKAYVCVPSTGNTPGSLKLAAKQGGKQVGTAVGVSAMPGDVTYDRIPQNNLSIDSVSSDFEKRAARFVLDGDPDTFWHSRWQSPAAEGPHWLIIDAHEAKDMTAVELTGRPRNNNNGRPKKVEIFVSNDKSNFGEPAVTATLPKQVMPIVIPLKSDGSAVSGRYVKIQIDSSWSTEGDFGSLSEVNLLTTRHVPQEPTIDFTPFNLAAPADTDNQEQQPGEQGSDDGEGSGDTNPAQPGEGAGTEQPVKPHSQHVALMHAPLPLVNAYVDVTQSTPFAGEATWLRMSGIANGWPDGTFRPWASVDRQMMAVFLYRMAGSPAVALEGKQFKDIDQSVAFAKEIQWMAQTGISTGWDDNTFRPYEPVSREAIAAFMYRACTKVPGMCNSDLAPGKLAVPAQPYFVDVQPGSQFFKEIQWLATARVTTGWDDNTFRPAAATQRAAMAAFLYRLRNNHLENN